MANSHQEWSRRERERMEHRLAIMDAAMELFAERGYANVSMQEIAAAAEFAVGTLYNIFASKEALYREIIRRSANSIYQELIPELDRGTDPKEKLRYFMSRHRSVFLTHAKAIRLYLSETIGLGVLTRDEEVHRLWQDGITRLTSIIEEGIEAGQFKQVDTRGAVLALSGALETMAFAEIEQGYITANPEQTLEEIFLCGLETERATGKDIQQ